MSLLLLQCMCDGRLLAVFDCSAFYSPQSAFLQIAIVQFQMGELQVLAHNCYTHIQTASPKPPTHNQHLILLFESLEADADDISLAKRLSYLG
jgi:hypothetical protein